MHAHKNVLRLKLSVCIFLIIINTVISRHHECDLHTYDDQPHYTRSYFAPLSDTSNAEPHAITIVTSNTTSSRIVSAIARHLLLKVLLYRQVQEHVLPVPLIDQIINKGDIVLDLMDTRHDQLWVDSLETGDPSLDKPEMLLYDVLGRLGVYDALSLNVPSWMEGVHSIEFDCHSSSSSSSSHQHLLPLFNNTLLKIKLDLIIDRLNPPLRHAPLYHGRVLNGVERSYRRYVRTSINASSSSSPSSSSSSSPSLPSLYSDSANGKLHREQFMYPYVTNGNHHSDRHVYTPHNCTIATCLIVVASSLSYNNSCILDTLPNTIIYFIGMVEMPRFVLEMHEARLPALYLSSHMHSLTHSGLLRPLKVSMRPPCNLNPRPCCSFRPLPLLKAISVNFTLSAPKIKHLIGQMSFTNQELISLVRKVDFNQSEASINQVACDWLKEGRWRKWVDRVEEKEQLYLGVFGPPENTLMLQSVMQTAVDYLNQQSSILPTHHFNLTTYTHPVSTTATTTALVRSFIELITLKPMMVSVGTVEGEFSRLPYIASLFDSPFVSIGATRHLFYRSTHNHTYFSMHPEFQETFFSMGKVFVELKWMKVACIIDRRHDSLFAYMKAELKKLDVSVVVEADVDDEDTQDVILKELQLIKDERASIVVLMLSSTLLPRILCALHQKEITFSKGFVFFDPLEIVKEMMSSRQSSSGSSNPHSSSCSSSIVHSFIKHLFSLHPHLPDIEADVQVYGKLKSQWQALILENDTHPVKTLPSGPNKRLLYEAFDAIILFGSLLQTFKHNYPSFKQQYHCSDEVFRELLTSYGMKHLKEELVRSSSMQGLSGGISFYGTSRSSKILLRQQEGDLNHTVVVGTYEADVVSLYRDKVTFLHGLPPPDIQDEVPPCELQGIATAFGVSCGGAIALLNVFIISPPIIAMILYICYMKRRYERRMKIMGNELSIALREKWEMKRQDITINRLLGQGEFGTVYGGELRTADNVWKAAAIKILKEKASDDEKLVFFGEADIMKDFDHANILKLEGIVSIEDPGMVLMEFMMHGDLRTYLLSRRHLALDPSTAEAFDIRPQALTRMVLDVALGLQYLARSRCVHRDLACRNCLVHESGVVKIADFGFAKKIVKGTTSKFIINKVPIRWLAPECLESGSFSHASDIWSYGVLLYEVISFANTPYQGMSNSEVMAWVMGGNILSLPSSTPPHLAAFLRDCWAFHKRDRVSIKTIISTLQSNPILLQPCLEMPLTSTPPPDSSAHASAHALESLPSHPSPELPLLSAFDTRLARTLPSSSTSSLPQEPIPSTSQAPPPLHPDVQEASKTLSVEEVREAGDGVEMVATVASRPQERRSLLRPPFRSLFFRYKKSKNSSQARGKRS